jgi:hypothetical protein
MLVIGEGVDAAMQPSSLFDTFMAHFFDCDPLTKDTSPLRSGHSNRWAVGEGLYDLGEFGSQLSGRKSDRVSKSGTSLGDLLKCDTIS